MTASLIAPAAQVCAFALGCAIIHAARAHVALVTHLLTGAAMIASALVLIASTAVHAPDDLASFDEITVYAALSINPAAGR